jgi:NADH-quinone oxidoreductase subunit N
VLGVIASAIGAYYYLRIVYYMYFGDEGEALTGRMPAMQWVMLAGSALFMLVGVVSLFGIGDAAMAAAVALVG